MNSRQGTRYIKSRMGADLKRTILMQNGIMVGDDEALKPKPAVHNCPRCNLVNTFETKYCSKCSYPLVPDAFDEIKEVENSKLQGIEERHRLDIDRLREELRVEREKTNQIWDMIQNNRLLTHVKPDVLAKKKLQ